MGMVLREYRNEYAMVAEYGRSGYSEAFGRYRIWWEGRDCLGIPHCRRWTSAWWCLTVAGIFETLIYADETFCLTAISEILGPITGDSYSPRST